MSHTHGGGQLGQSVGAMRSDATAISSWGCSLFFFFFFPFFCVLSISPGFARRLPLGCTAATATLHCSQAAGRAGRLVCQYLARNAKTTAALIDSHRFFESHLCVFSFFSPDYISVDKDAAGVRARVCRQQPLLWSESEAGRDHWISSTIRRAVFDPGLPI